LGFQSSLFVRRDFETRCRLKLRFFSTQVLHYILSRPKIALPIQDIRVFLITSSQVKGHKCSLKPHSFFILPLPFPLPISLMPRDTGHTAVSLFPLLLGLVWLPAFSSHLAIASSGTQVLGVWDFSNSGQFFIIDIT